MTRLVHLTDLHFGLHRADFVAPLQSAIRASAPDLVVVSGDLSQRARRPQFLAAMAFIHNLGRPFLVIPGNHDIPLYNLFARLLRPFGRYRATVGTQLTPVLDLGELRIFGTNTVDPFRWRGGVIRNAEIDRICAALQGGGSNVTNVLVAHHPFEVPAGFERGETRGASAALDRLAEAGLHVLMTGHLHHWSTGLGISPDTSQRVFQMQTGTALCARPQERYHGFTVMDFDARHLTITRSFVNGTGLGFDPQPLTRFAYHGGRWHAAD